MSLLQLRASLALWRARFKWRDARWNYWRKKNNPQYVAKWEKLRLEAINRINLRKRQIGDLEHPARTTMYDSVTVSEIPGNAEAVAGYTSGNWPTYHELLREFPKAKHLSIAVNAFHDADCLDVEVGDATPAEVPAWVRRQQKLGKHRPMIYANQSTWPSVIDALVKSGLKLSEVRRWMALYDGNPVVPAGYDGKQYSDKALGRNLDVSITLASFWT